MRENGRKPAAVITETDDGSLLIRSASRLRPVIGDMPGVNYCPACVAYLAPAGPMAAGVLTRLRRAGWELSAGHEHPPAHDVEPEPAADMDDEELCAIPSPMRWAPT